MMPRTLITAGIRERLIEGRAKLFERHQAGESGVAVARGMGFLVEEIVRALYDDAIDSLADVERPTVERGLAVVATAGFGRGALAPFSDVDVLFLCESLEREPVVAFARQLVRQIWDVGLVLAHNLATAGDVVGLLDSDTKTATALLECRLVAGSSALFLQLQDRLAPRFRGANARRIAWQACEAIQEERNSHGTTAFVLEPDVKRSAGGLRDLHLVRWLERLLGPADDSTGSASSAATVESRALAPAYNFLLRVRAELHFAVGKSNDALLRPEQWRIARTWGYRDSPSMRAVEQFMRDYFRHAYPIAELANDWIESLRPKSFSAQITDFLRSRRFGEGIRVVGDRLVLTDAVLAETNANLDRLLEIIEICATHEVDPERSTLQSWRRNYGATSWKESAGDSAASANVPPVSATSAQTFLRILAKPGRLESLLRSLHQTGVLERIIPQFEHARGLLQFNEYHKYTVDEHTFVLLGHAEGFAKDAGGLGQAYRRVNRKDLLHLAILLHDLGKGFPEDHSLVGRGIALEVADRLHLPDSDREVVALLVLQHLTLSRLAYHRDTSDPKILVQLTRLVGTSAVLRALYVLTAADNMAVGPGTFTRWKADLLADVYRRAMMLFGLEDGSPRSGTEDELITRYPLLTHHVDAKRTLPRDPSPRQRVQDAIAGDLPAQDLLALLPDELLGANSVELIKDLLGRWHRFDASRIADVWMVGQPRTQTVLVNVLTNERVADGIVHKVCAGLTAHRLDVLSARILTLADRTVIDQFEVHDLHHAGDPTSDREKRVSNTVRSILGGTISATDALYATRSSLFLQPKATLGHENTRVVIDNDSSDTSTIVDVFTGNRRGLLYVLTKGIHRLGLSIIYAKIATYGNDAVDVFYVREIDGHKVGRDDRATMIRDHIAADILTLATQPRSMGL